MLPPTGTSTTWGLTPKTTCGRITEEWAGAMASCDHSMSSKPQEDAMGESQLMTPLGVIAGEVLTYLDAHGPTTLRHLVDALDWPAPLITMGVGALIREALAEGRQEGLEILVGVKPQTSRKRIVR